MSNGGGENGREHHQRHGKSKFGGNDFAFAVTKIAVAQICEHLGFQTFQQSALDTLSDVAVRYIESVGKSACLNANLAGRVEGNAFDIIQGLEESGSGQGFSVASDVDHCLTDSGIVREIIQYVADSDNVPFAYSLSRFPFAKDCKLAPSFLQRGEEPPDEHIPAWLPAFPHPEMRETTISHPDKAEPTKPQTKTNGSLLNLQQRFTCNGSDVPSSVDAGDTDRASKAVESNPFISAPLHFGEKEVSHLVLPSKISNEGVSRNHVAENHAMENHVSVLDAFAPAIEAVQSRKCDSENGLANQRPSVHFKIGMGKNSIGVALNSGSRSKDSEKISSSYANSNEKDDKRRRVESILMESIGNSGTG